ncbi:MAG: winged helix-turn-helix transcriptional regulator, partial [Candidatus Woesearchaeota archaeon]
MLTILNTSNMCDMCNNVQIYKTSDFVKESEAMNVSEYAFDSKQSKMFFVDASNNVNISTLEQNQILNLGSGIVNVRFMLKKNGNKDLEYILHKIETKVIVYSQVYSEKWSELTERQITILQTIQKNPKISRKELADEIKINQSAIQKHLKKLK